MCGDKTQARGILHFTYLQQNVNMGINCLEVVTIVIEQLCPGKQETCICCAV